jgi:selenocysteine-specific elongation factor
MVWLEHLNAASAAQQIVLRVGRRKTRGITLPALSAETGWTVDAILRQSGPSLESGELLRLSGNLLIDREALVAATGAIITHLQSNQTTKSSELRSQTALSPDVFDLVLNVLLREHKVQFRDETVAIFNAAGQSSDAEIGRLAAVAQAYEAAGLAAPSVVELGQRLAFKEADMRRLVTLLQRNKTLVRMGSDNLFIHSDALKQLTAQLAALRGSPMDVARFKQLTGLSRKYAIPLLEYLDRQRITRIQGDQRLVL